MTWPACTWSPSRTVISRIRPEVLAPTAESSPSIRPLTAMTPAGVPGAAKNAFHMPNAPRPMSTSAAAIITRGRLCRPGAGGCGDFAPAGGPEEAEAAAGAGTTAGDAWPLAVGVFGSIVICVISGSPFRYPADLDRSPAGSHRSRVDLDRGTGG